MPLEMSEGRELALTSAVTKPLYLVVHQHSGATEYASSLGEVIFDGETFVAGGVSAIQVEDSRVASFSLFATTARQTQVQAGTWRDGDCVVYLIPEAADNPGPYTMDDAIELIYGKLTTSSYDGKARVSVTATHQNNLNRLANRITWDEICPFCPAAGTTLTWEGDRVVLSAEAGNKAKAANVSNPSTNVRGRLSAIQLKELSQTSTSFELNATGRGAPISTLYGERAVPGKILAVGSDSGDLVVVVGWCWGEIESFEAVFINGASPPGGVTVGHHKGEHNQAVDTYLSGGAIPAWNIPLIYEGVEENMGAAYSWFRIPSGQIDQAPVFHAIIRGKRVFDARTYPFGVNDPLESTDVAIVFSGPGEPRNDAPLQSVQPTVTGGAQIVNRGLLCDAPGKGFTLPYDPGYVLGINWCLEIEFVVRRLDTASERVELYNQFNFATNDRSVLLRLNGDGNLVLWLSSTGTSWDVVNGANLGNLSGRLNERVHVAITGTGTGGKRAIVNGINSLLTSNTSSLHDPVGVNPYVGGQNGASGQMSVSILSLRVWRGGPRYGTGNINAGGYPFPDCVAYSDNSALAAADFARSTVYGLASFVTGDAESADWDDSLIDGAYERCRIALLLSDTRKAADYLDYLADHAECVWYNEGRYVHLKPDKKVDATNPSGQLICSSPNFEVPADWSGSPPGTGNTWLVSVGSASADGSQSVSIALYQEVLIGPGESIVIDCEVSAVSGILQPYLRDIVRGYNYLSPGVSLTAPGRLQFVFTTDNYWSNEVVMRPGVVIDAGGTATVTNLTIRRLYWRERGFVEGSLRVLGLNDADSPTSVKTRYTQVSATPYWPEAVTTPILRPAAAAGEIPEVETTLSMQGVYRSAEALNKANAKLQRYVNRVRYTWESFDYGVRFRKADVIELDPEFHGFDELVWVESVKMVSPGRYRITGLRYDVAHYPDEIVVPDDAGVVPVGLIMPLTGTSVPSGWANYTAANGRFLMGAGGTYDSQDTGGSATFAGWSGNTPTTRTHQAGSGGGTPPYSAFPVQELDFTPPEGLITQYGVNNGADTIQHNHTYDTGAIDPDVLRRTVKLVKKTGSTSVTVPPEITPLGLPGLLASGMSRLTSNAGRLLMADVAASNAGVLQKFVNVVSGSANDAHTHITTSTRSGELSGLTTVFLTYTPETGGGPHTHTYNYEFTRNVRRCRVALYGGTEAMPVLPGMIGFWDEVADGPIPANWVICDGNNGTPPIQNRLIEIANDGNEGTTAGNNAVSWGGPGTSVGHDHQGAGDNSAKAGHQAYVRHGNSFAHGHDLSGKTGTWQPPFYALSAIMFQPS